MGLFIGSLVQWFIGGWRVDHALSREAGRLYNRSFAGAQDDRMGIYRCASNNSE